MRRLERRTVFIVAKAPRAGHVKTRLCTVVTPEQAADLAAAFIRDAISIARRAGADVRLICRDEEERALLHPLADGVTIHVQQGKGLGAALESAFSLGLGRGSGVAVLGADTPTLPPAAIATAFSALETCADVALGQTSDGGYYLLAARRLYPPLFRRMPWSTGHVAAETLRRCAALGLRTRLLAPWFDVDDAASLARLRADLESAPRDVAPHTRAALDRLPAARATT